MYLYYTVPLAGHNRLSRVQALGNFALPGSEEVLLELDPMAGTIHNAGAMAFGADGKLYLAVGEGADGAKAPKLTSLLGKILRLNPDGTVPADNPFYDQTTGIYRAIYATGLRNPFSMAIQPGTDRIFVCDVGTDVLGRLIQPPTEPLYAAQGDSNACMAQSGSVIGAAIRGAGQMLAEQRQMRT